jgi:hypothetical protein
LLNDPIYRVLAIFSDLELGLAMYLHDFVGYLPAKNVGKVKDLLVDLINEAWGRSAGHFKRQCDALTPTF